jgi:ElaB/YqjD/DUF883 family membrane-anchored ribosome-binding protein
MNTTNLEEPHVRAQEPAAGRKGSARSNRSEFDGTSASSARRIKLDRLREVARNLGGQLDEQVHKRPYAVLGAALGVGFAAGSVLGSRLGQVLLAGGLGYVAKHFLGPDFGIERIQATLEKLAAEAERRATPS